MISILNTELNFRIEKEIQNRIIHSKELHSENKDIDLAMDNEHGHWDTSMHKTRDKNYRLNRPPISACF